jgi:hypothetical protein
MQVCVAHLTVWRVLQEQQLCPYHLQYVQALSLQDYSVRVMFCQWFLHQSGTNLNIPVIVIFTDEAQFTGDGIQKFHNQHLWADENPHAILPLHHQQLFSINISASICGDNLFRPHVLPNRLTGRNYKAFLENNMPGFLADMPLIIRQKLHFMHDGAPAHFSLVACRYLNQKLQVDG